MKKQKIEIHRLKKHDADSFKQVIALFNEVFENKNKKIPKKGYLKKLLGNPGFIVYYAKHGKAIIGCITAFVLPSYYEKASELFIYDVAIKQDYQRQGIGKMLLSAFKDYCKKEGITEMFVAAHSEDKHALAFYRSTGGKEEEVVHFNYGV